MLGSLFRSAGVYAGTSALGAIVPFLLVPVLTRHLAPQAYGIAAMFLTVTAFLGALTGLSVHGAVNVRWFDPEHFDRRTYVGTCLWILLASTAFTLVLVLALGGFVTSTLGLSLPWLALAVLCSGLTFLVNVRLTIWQVSFEAPRYAAMQLTMTVANAGLAVLLVVALDLGWQGRVAAQAATTIGAGIFAWLTLQAAGFVVARPDPAATRDALRFGLPLVPHALGGLLLGMSDRLIVASVLGLAHAGLYAAGAQVGMVMGLATDAFNRAYSPWLFSRLKDADGERKRELVRFTYLYFVALLCCTGAYALLSPWLFELLVGSRYAGAREVSIWIALGGAFQGMYYMVGLYIAYSRRTHYLAGITLTGGVVNVPLTLYFVDQFGAVGAARAYALTQALFFLLAWTLSQRSYPMPWTRSLR
jgi:O-antigen/teichoic acid export membrane protein